MTEPIQFKTLFHLNQSDVLQGQHYLRVNIF